MKSQHDGRRKGLRSLYPPHFLRKLAPPMSASRRLRLRSGGLGRRFPAGPGGLVLDGEDRKRRQAMTQILVNSAAADQVRAALVSGLEIEFGRAAGTALAVQFLDAEEWTSTGMHGSRSAESEAIAAPRMRKSGSTGPKSSGGWTGAGSSRWCSSTATATRTGCLASAASGARSRQTRHSRMHEFRPRWSLEALPYRRRVPALFLRRMEEDQGRKGKQDKGSVSRPCSSVCLHIILSRDRRPAHRDMPHGSGGKPRFPAEFRETPEARR